MDVATGRLYVRHLHTRGNLTLLPDGDRRSYDVSARANRAAACSLLTTAWRTRSTTPSGDGHAVEPT